MADFDALIREAENLPLVGWDFTPIGSRWQHGTSPWDLSSIVRGRFHRVDSFLDIGTGGGEFLASLAPLPAHTFATEGYAPNVPVARQRLEPLGVRVLSIAKDRRIDLPSSSIDLVLSRHEEFDPFEVARVLRPGGALITQQVGGRNYSDLHRRFGVPPEPAFNRLESADSFAREILESHLAVDDCRECTVADKFLDVGAVIYFLRAAPWEVPGFSVERFHHELEELHREIERAGPWELTAHRLLLLAHKDPLQ